MKKRPHRDLPVMRPLGRLLVALALVASCGSPSVPEHKLTAVGPPTFPIVYSDPSTGAGRAGAVGDICQLSGGTAGWQKTGTSSTAWTAINGSALASISTTPPLGGLGTSGSPLTISNANPDAGGIITGAQAAALLVTPTFDPTPGTAPGATVAYSLSVDTTQAANTDMGVIVPGRTGKSFIPIRYCSSVIAVTGTASGTAPAYSWGTIGPTYTDGQSSGSALGVGTINQGPRAYGCQNIVASGAQPVSGATTHVKLVTPVTGASVCTIYVTLIGYWLPG